MGVYIFPPVLVRARVYCVFQGEGGPEGKRGLAGEVGNKGTKVMSSESITPIHIPCTLTQFTGSQPLIFQYEIPIQICSIPNRFSHYELD